MANVWQIENTDMNKETDSGSELVSEYVSLTHDHYCKQYDFHSLLSKHSTGNKCLAYVASEA